MQITVLVLDESNKVTYNKVRETKREYAFGNFGGAVLEMKSGGKRHSLKILPEPTYNKKNPLPYVVLRKTGDTYEKLLLTDYYDILEVRKILFPLENAMRYITGRLRYGL